MQLKSNLGWSHALLIDRKIFNHVSINKYYFVVTLIVNLIIINSFGGYTSCQAQTTSNLDNLETLPDKSPVHLRETKVPAGDRWSILSNQEENIPLNISIDTSNSSTSIEDRKGRDNRQNNYFSLRDSSIKVKNIDVLGNTLFKAEIERLTKPFVGKSTNLAELYKLRSSISELYTDKGYVNSGAYLPPQKLKNGVIKIKVLEGEIETVSVTGNKHLNDDYIASRLASIPTPVQAEKLLEQLQLLRLDPLIKNVSAELSSGLSPGMSRLDIEVEEADSFALSSSLNNHNSPSIGSNSRNVGLTHSNLLGFGDRASLNYTNTKGSNGLDFGYGFPINAKDGRISLAYGFNSNDIIEAPFTPLDIETKSNYYELNLRQPIIAKPTHEVALGLSFSRQHSESYLLGQSFPLSLGADELGNTNISALRFFQEFTKRNDESVLALRSQFSLGVDLFDATNNDDAPDGQFLAWRGQSQWARQLDDDLVLLLKGDIQLANGLLPLEQFRLGGASSVRGYRRDVSLSDSGFFTSAELRVPVLRIQKLDGVFQLVPFVDFGLPWGGDNAVLEIDSLMSIGMGLNFNAGDRFNARLDYGIPLVGIEVEGDSLQEDGLTFSLGHSF